MSEAKLTGVAEFEQLKEKVAALERANAELRKQLQCDDEPGLPAEDATETDDEIDEENE
jgi:hypothetical protein